MIIDSSPDTILHELEELLSIAEDTTKKIKEMQEVISNQRDGFIYKSFGLYAILGSSLYAFSYTMDVGISWNLRQFLQLLIVTFAGFSFFYFFRLFILITRQRKIINKELAIERDIHARLVSMIFDQVKRAKQLGHLTTISEALIHIRVERLKSD